MTAFQLDLIHKGEYAQWKSTGIAFEIREAIPSIPNRTMATVNGLKESGVTVSKWGYFSDIATGPFVSFGVDPNDEKLLLKANDRYSKVKQMKSL